MQLELLCECLFASPCSWEKVARVASNLSKMDDMRARLQRNLEAIGMLNQQVSSAHTHVHSHAHTLLYADRRRHGPTLQPTCCRAHSEGDGGAFMRPTSKLSPCTSISSSCDKSRKKKEVGTRLGGVGWGELEGGVTNGVRRRRWRVPPPINDFPFMEPREGCISIQLPLISPWQRREMACCDETMWVRGGGERIFQFFWGKGWHFCIVFLLLQTSQESTNHKSQKETCIKSLSQPFQFPNTNKNKIIKKTHGDTEEGLLLVCRTARWLTGGNGGSGRGTCWSF